MLMKNCKKTSYFTCQNIKIIYITNYKCIKNCVYQQVVFMCALSLSVCPSVSFITVTHLT